MLSIVNKSIPFELVLVNDEAVPTRGGCIIIQVPLFNSIKCQQKKNMQMNVTFSREAFHCYEVSQKQHKQRQTY